MVDVATFFFYARFEIHKICIERLFLWLWIISSNQYPHFIIITQCCICILPSISNEIHNSATNPMNPWQFYVGKVTCILINGTGRRGMGICWQCLGLNCHHMTANHLSVCCGGYCMASTMTHALNIFQKIQLPNCKFWF